MPLYVSVEPGLTVTDDTTLDAAALNQLGTPVVNIQGTLDGSSALSVGAGTVTNAMLFNMNANTVKGRDESAGVPVDLTMHSSMDIASGALKVADGGITTTQLASAATTAAGAIADVNIATGVIGANKLKAQAALTLLGNGGDTASAAPEPILIGTGLTVTNADEIATATRSRTANVATITTGSAHGYSVGDKVNVTGLGGTGYSAYGVTTLTGTTGSTVVYASVNVDGSGTPINEGSTSDTGGKVRRIEAAGVPTSTIAMQPNVQAYCTFFPKVTTGLSYNKSGTAVVVTQSSNNVKVGDVITIKHSTQVNIKLVTVTARSSTTWTFTEADSYLPSGASTLDRSMCIRKPTNVSNVLLEGTAYHVTFTTSLTSSDYSVLATATGHVRLISINDDEVYAKNSAGFYMQARTVDGADFYNTSHVTSNVWGYQFAVFVS